MPRLFILAAAVLIASFALAAEEPKPAPAVPLFDGKTLAGWVTAAGKPVTGGWIVEDGVLTRAAKGGDIFTEKEYADFELELDWKISDTGNSGVKYRVTQYGSGELLGPEYQIIDDLKHPDGVRGTTHQTAALYDLLEPNDKKDMKPVGEWNHTKIVAKGTVFEHWLNGKKVVEMDTASDLWKEKLAKSKFKGKKDFAQNKSGKIMLQDHGDKVWFRNITVRELK
jgi:hypothetical protein